MTAGKRKRDELAGFHKFQLRVVDLLAKSVDDGRLGVGGLKRRQDFAQGLRHVDRNLGVQTLRVLQADFGVENIKVGARGGAPEWPVQIE